MALGSVTVSPQSPDARRLGRCRLRSTNAIRLCYVLGMKKHEAGISFRVSKALRDAAAAKATERGERLSDVLRRALEQYVKKS